MIKPEVAMGSRVLALEGAVLEVTKLLVAVGSRVLAREGLILDAYRTSTLGTP